MQKKHPDVVSPLIVNNETWNDCPECGKAWKDKKAIPGLIHRTRLCDRCYPIVKEKYEANSDNCK